MEDFSFRRLGYALAALVVVLIGGMVGFHQLLGEGWIESFYRAVVTVSLTGIDTKPPGSGAQLFTILTLVAGVPIFPYIAGASVEIIARAVSTGAWAVRRRRGAL